jgi:glutamate synthase domain-containing protein 3
MRIDAKGLQFKQLNKLLRDAVHEGAREIEVVNVNGQRYIGTGINGGVRIIIRGTPGNDLGAFMDSPTIISYGDAGDCAGNTMNAGRIIIHGGAGDVVGYSMRGGEIYIRGDVGYRVGIHMKEYSGRFPVIVIGGVARSFLGEYMAGGRIVVLGLEENDGELVGDYLGTGMHGGKMYIRGVVPQEKLGIGVKVDSLNESDLTELRRIITDYCETFEFSPTKILESSFKKVVPITHRPYGKMYAVYPLEG